jgi:2,5-dihydroxypyridine 5,6-dioxygenase
MTFHSDAACLAAVDVLLKDHFCVRPDESVVLTADNRSDPSLVRALTDGVSRLGATACVVSFAQLPFQGALADPFIPGAVSAAVCESDVWLDLSFPYMAGSGPFERAMKEKRARYLLLGDLSAAGFGRVYGSADFDALFSLQSAADRLFAEAQGQRCRITSPAGTDLEFLMGRPATVKHRRATMPGAQTVPGSAIFYPEIDSVRGTIALESVFHEYYTSLAAPLMLEVEGVVRQVTGGSDSAVLDRSLRRAGGGSYGHVIHLTVGLNPGALRTGRSFIEDIRVVGCNAVGLGLPWWVPGGGENHPDGVVFNQSLWVGGEPIVEQGLPAAGHPLAALLKAAAPARAVRPSPQ